PRVDQRNLPIASLLHEAGLAPSFHATKETSPAFFAHAGNDPFGAENSVRAYLALERAGVPAELHVYASGGHGFGLRKTDEPCSSWPQRCEEWMRKQGVLGR